MAKVILRAHPLDRDNYAVLEFNRDISSDELIKFMKLEHVPLFCKVNGKIPDIIDDDFIFSGKDIVEISTLVEGGGGGDGGGKSAVATILTIAVVVAATAVTGGAAAGLGLGLAAGSTAAAIAGAAIAIGGNLLINSLFPADVPGNQIEPQATTGIQINDVGISAARNTNPFGQTMKLPMGNCCRIAPPHGMQPYTSLEEVQATVERFDFFWVKNEDLDMFPCAQVCLQFKASDIPRVMQEHSTSNNPGATLDNPVGSTLAQGAGASTIGWFGEKQMLPGGVYPYNVSPMYLDDFDLRINVNPQYNTFNILKVRQNPCLTPGSVYVHSRFIRTSGVTFTTVQGDQGNSGACNLNGADPNTPVLWQNNIGQNSGFSFFQNYYTQDTIMTSQFWGTKGAGAGGVGLEGYSGIRFDCWVVLCDPDDPFFGSYVRLSALEEAGYDPNLITDPDDLINGNPTIDPDTGEIIEMEPFCDRQAEYCVRDVINTSKYVKRVHQLFNIGFGDLKISDTFFGTTPTTELQQFEETQNIKETDDWPMPDDSCVEERVDTTPGGTLTHNDVNDTWEGASGTEGPETIIPVDNFDQHNWVERCGVVKTNKIVVLIEGQLYNASPVSGIQGHSELIQIQYRPYNSTNAWTPFNASPATLQGYDTFPVREEYVAEPLPLDKYCVRVRRVTIENSNPNVTSNINFSEVKWFQEDCKAITKDGEEVATDYKGQNRIGTCLVASGQTSGALGNYTAKVSNNLWMFDIDEFKATGVKNWVWDCEAGDTKNNNPAFQLLYFLRGGYCNGAADPTASPATTPLDGGHTDFGWHNGEHPDNEELMWGGGLAEKEIDLDCICDWACFNHENNFCFDYYLCGDKTVKEMIDLITRAGRATWSQHSGKLCPIWEEADQPFVTIFSEENILQDSFQVCYDSRGQYDRVTVTYTSQNEEIDPGNTVDDQESFDGKPIQIVSEVPFAKERGENLSVQLVGVRKKKQAQREANILAAKQFYQKRTYTWDTDIEHLCVTRGDIVLLSSDLTQPSFSSRIREFEVTGGNVTKLNLTRSMEKPITKIRIKLVCGDILEADVTKQDDKTLCLTTEVLASQFPVYTNQVNGCNPMNLSDKTFGEYPEDIMIIGAPMNTPGKRVRITNIEVQDLCKASITAVDDDPAIWAYEYHCCPDPVELPEQEVVPFVCAKVKDISIEDCGEGLIKVCYETDGAYAVQATYSLNGGTPVNVMSNGQYTITNDCFELQLSSGDNVEIKIMPFVIGEPYSNEDGCITYTVV